MANPLNSNWKPLHLDDGQILYVSAYDDIWLDDGAGNISLTQLYPSLQAHVSGALTLVADGGNIQVQGNGSSAISIDTQGGGGTGNINVTAGGGLSLSSAGLGSTTISSTNHDVTVSAQNFATLSCLSTAGSVTVSSAATGGSGVTGMTIKTQNADLIVQNTTGGGNVRIKNLGTGVTALTAGSKKVLIQGVAIEPTGGSTGNVLAQQSDGSFTPQAPLTAMVLTNAHIYVGNASNVPTDVAMSGDATIANTGALTISAGAVTLAKMANLSANSIIGNNTGSSAVPLALTRAQVMAMLSGNATADFSMNTNKLTSVKDPSAAQDAATKNYVDANAPGAILAVHNYTPASLTSFALTATPKTKLDTTNLTISFTAPASGKVFVDVALSAYCQPNAASQASAQVQLIAHGTTTQVGQDVVAVEEVQAATTTLVVVPSFCRFYITGLTPGASLQYDLAAYYVLKSGTIAASAVIAGDGTAGGYPGITMTVTAAL